MLVGVALLQFLILVQGQQDQPYILKDDPVYHSMLSDLNIKQTDINEALNILGESNDILPIQLAQAVAAANKGEHQYTPQDFANAFSTSRHISPNMSVADFGKAIQIASTNKNLNKYTIFDYSEAVVIAADAGYILLPQQFANALIQAAFEGGIYDYPPQSYAQALAHVSGIHPNVSIHDFADAVSYAARFGNIYYYTPMAYAYAMKTCAEYTLHPITAFDFSKAIVFLQKGRIPLVYSPIDFATAIVQGSMANPNLKPMDFAQAVVDGRQMAGSSQAHLQGQGQGGELSYFSMFDYAEAMSIASSVGYSLWPQTFADASSSYKNNPLFTPQAFAEAMSIAAEQGLSFTAQDFVVAIDTLLHDNNLKYQEHAPQEFAHAVALVAGAGQQVSPVQFSQALITASVSGEGDSVFYLTPQDFGEGIVAALGKGYFQNLTMIDLAVAVQISNRDATINLKPQDFGEAIGNLYEAGIYVDPIELAEGIAFVANIRGVVVSPQDVVEAIKKQVEYGTYKVPMLAADSIIF